MLGAGMRLSRPWTLITLSRESENGATDYDNLIALCPNHHRDKAAGRIDRPALRIMKANQVLLNARYSDLERRLLSLLGEGQASIDAHHAKCPAVDDGQSRAVQIVWHPMNFEFAMLLRDGLVEETTLTFPRLRSPTSAETLGSGSWVPPSMGSRIKVSSL